AVEEELVARRQAVLGDRDRQLVAVVEEARAPVERARRDRLPVDARARVARREWDLLRLAVRALLVDVGLVDVEAEIVERLLHLVEVARLELRHVLAEERDAV